MKNKGNEIKDKVKKYIKENPVALFSTICVLFEIVCSCVFYRENEFCFLYNYDVNNFYQSGTS